jgi:hypothetical protein
VYIVAVASFHDSPWFGLELKGRFNPMLIYFLSPCRLNSFEQKVWSSSPLPVLKILYNSYIHGVIMPYINGVMTVFQTGKGI